SGASRRPPRRPARRPVQAGPGGPAQTWRSAPQRARLETHTLRAMAARNLRQRIEELTVVADIASAMLSPLELSQVLDVALERASRGMGAPFGSITLLSADQTRLEFAADYGERFREIGLLPADASSPSGRAVSTGKPYWVADITRHPLCASWKHISLGERSEEHTSELQSLTNL